ncbi:MAG: TolC family protein [Steroidobacteraceae bacterium]|jgi:outer membrane protein TolC
MNIRIPSMRGIATVGALASALSLAACAHFSQDGGFDAVARTAEPRIGLTALWKRTPQDRAAADRDTKELLARPLSADDAVRIALLNNGSLQAAFAELGIAEADVVQSGRLPNPRFTVRRSSAQGLNDVEETVTVSVLALLTAPYIHGIEKQRFAAVQASCAADIVRLAARTRATYYMALAARETAHDWGEVAQAADAAAELAQRMHQAGNWSPLDEARERSFHAEAALELDRARLAETLAREDLIESLGVDIEPPNLELADHLPDVPPSIEDLAEIERAALDNRIDLKAMRANLEALARDLHLTRATRLVNVLDAGPTRVQQGPDSAPYESGFEVSLEMPLFDTGAPRVRKAEARYAQALARYGQAAIEARAQVRKAYARLSATHDIALRQHDEMLPLRKSIAEQDRLRYDAGQASVFELLADSRAEIAGVSDYIQSVRDFWVARASLDAALAGSQPQL